jgi:hypothetical protein
MAVTELYQKLIAAEQAEKAADYALPEQKVYLAAAMMYYQAVAKKRAEWKTIPDSLDKIRAEENADETEDTHIDGLRWYEIAFATYEEYKTL